MHRLAYTLPLLLGLSLTGQPKTWNGSWSASAGNGAAVFRGTWDAALSSEPDTVAGNWTLTDAHGEAVARGTWAARKNEKIWRGNWQARTSSDRVYTGTWRAQSLPAAARFPALFESAVTDAVSGTWRMGSTYSGSWSIRVYPRP